MGQLNSASIYNVNRDSYTINVSTDGGITSALSSIPRLNEGSVTLRLSQDITDDVVIENFLGNGSILVDLNGHKLNGSLICQGSSPTYIHFYGGTINAKSDNISRIDRCNYVVLENLKMYGNNVCNSGVYVHSGSAAQIVNCEIYDVSTCVSGGTSSQVNVRDCKGLGSNNGFNAFYANYIILSGTVPGGSVADIAGSYSGQVETRTSYSIDYGAATPPAPPETTKRWTATDGGGWRPNFGGQWYNDQPLQGEWSGYGPYKGCWFFGSGLANTLSGKTIKSARAYIKREAHGGYSSNQPIVLRYHNYTSQPSGEPSLSSEGAVTVNLEWGESAWVNLPSSWFNNFSGGSAAGIGVYNGSSGYAYMGNTCYLTVYLSIGGGGLQLILYDDQKIIADIVDGITSLTIDEQSVDWGSGRMEGIKLSSRFTGYTDRQ